MSTHALIAAKQPDKSYKAIYCHFDGYPEHTGKILLQHYNTQEKINALLKLKALSYLAENIAPIKEYDEPAYSKPNSINELVKHSFDTPQKNVTVAYARDRGDDFQDFSFKTIAGLLNKSPFYDYTYVFEDDKWLFVNLNKKDSVLSELTLKDCGVE